MKKPTWRSIRNHVLALAEVYSLNRSTGFDVKKEWKNANGDRQSVKRALGRLRLTNAARDAMVSVLHNL